MSGRAGSRDATAVLSAYAREYDAPRRRLIPVIDAFYGAAVAAEQRRLFAEVVERLRPGGAFVDAEQVAGPSLSRSAGDDRIWERHARAGGARPEETEAAHRRFELDRCADTETLLEWLRDAGFVEVDCVFRWWRFGVFTGWKPAA